MSLEEEASKEGNADADDDGMMDVATQEMEDREADDKLGSVVPLADGLVTLSNLPKSRWCNLQHLDTIKEHNKPVEPPKQPKQAPFFLPTMPGVNPTFKPVSADSDGDKEAGMNSKILNLGKLLPLSEFQKTLQQCAMTGQCETTPTCHTHSQGPLCHADGALMELLEELSPAAIDGELRSLAPESGGSVEWLQAFMQFMLSQLKTNLNFELTEAYLGLFLKVCCVMCMTTPTVAMESPKRPSHWMKTLPSCCKSRVQSCHTLPT